MAGKARDDLKSSITYLAALRKIHVLCGEDTEATKLKNIIDAGSKRGMSESQSKVYKYFIIVKIIHKLYTKV